MKDQRLQLFGIGLLIIATLSVLYAVSLLSKQQDYIEELQVSLNKIKRDCDNSDLERQLKKVENSLSSDIDEVRRIVYYLD